MTCRRGIFARLIYRMRVLVNARFGGANAHGRHGRGNELPVKPTYANAELYSTASYKNKHWRESAPTGTRLVGVELCRPEPAASEFLLCHADRRGSQPSRSYERVVFTARHSRMQTSRTQWSREANFGRTDLSSGQLYSTASYKNKHARANWPSG